MGIHRVGFGSAADVRVPPVPLDERWRQRTVASVAHDGLEYCLDCIDLFDALGNDYGEGD